MKKFLKGLALTILVLVLFISTSGVLLLLPVKNTIKKDSVKEMITSLEIEKMVQDDPNFKKAVDEVFEPIYEETRNLGIEDEVIIKIMDSDEVKGLIGDVTGNITDYIVTGKNQKLINTDNIESLVDKAITDINKSGYYEIKPEEKEEILTVIREEVNEYQELLPETNVIDETFSQKDMESLNTIRFILGNKLIMILGIAMAVSIIGIILFKLKEAKWIKWNSLTIMFSSLLTSIITVIFLILNNALFRLDYAYIFKTLSKTINYSMILSFSVLILMIIILITYHIVSKSYKKELKAETKKA